MSDGQHFYLVGASRDFVGYERELAARGRRCGHDGCTSILSVYNTTEYCALHKLDAEDDPEHMHYLGHVFAHCPVCERIIERRHFDYERHLCKSCRNKADGLNLRTAPMRVCSRCGEKKPNTVQYWPQEGRRCKACVGALWNERNAAKQYNSKAHAKRRQREAS